MTILKMDWRLAKNVWNIKEQTVLNIEVKWMKHKGKDLKRMKNIEKRRNDINGEWKPLPVPFVILQWGSHVIEDT